MRLNDLDWKLQDAKQKCELLKERRIPIGVMEPVRGGRLANVPERYESKMRIIRPEESTAAWAFHWVQTIPDAVIAVIVVRLVWIFRNA